MGGLDSSCQKDKVCCHNHVRLALLPLADSWNPRAVTATRGHPGTSAPMGDQGKCRRVAGPLHEWAGCIFPFGSRPQPRRRTERHICLRLPRVARKVTMKNGWQSPVCPRNLSARRGRSTKRANSHGLKTRRDFMIITRCRCLEHILVPSRGLCGEEESLHYTSMGE